MKYQINVKNKIQIHVFNLLNFENDQIRNSLLAKKKATFPQ